MRDVILSRQLILRTCGILCNGCKSNDSLSDGAVSLDNPTQASLVSNNIEDRQWLGLTPDVVNHEDMYQVFCRISMLHELKPIIL